MCTLSKRLKSRFLFQSVVLSGCAILLTLQSGCNLSSGYTANQMGKARYKTGNYQGAYYEFRRAIIDQPRNADFHYNLAAALNKQGDVGGAETAYRQALYKDPAHQPSYHALAQVLNSQGRTAEARDLLHAWVDTQPYNAGSHVEMAWLQRETGDMIAAEKSLQSALKVQPNHPIALAQLGQIYQDSGQPDRATALYQRSLKSHWQQPQVRSRLAGLRGQYRPSQASRFAGLPSIYGPHPAYVNRYGGLPAFGRDRLVRSPYGAPAASPYATALEPIPMDSAIIPNADPAHSELLGSESSEGENR